MPPKPPEKPPPKPKGAKGGGKGGIREFFASFFRKSEPPQTPIAGFGVRIKNTFQHSYRGIIGVAVPAAFLSWQFEKGNNKKTVELMWMWMFWFLLVQPVSIPVTGLIPIFLLPMTGALSTNATCSCYMTENSILYMLAAMLILLLNNSGIDRRIALWFLCSGDACQFSAKRLIFKGSSAAFFLSMFSSRLISTSIIMQYMAPVFLNLKTTMAKNAAEPDFDEIRYIVLNSVQTAASIGSTAMLHSATSTILFRAIWCEAPRDGKEYPDIFNYLQYSAFAFPVAFFMFVFNFCYHMCLINWRIGKCMSSSSMTAIRTALLRSKAELPKRLTTHEKLSVIFLILYVLAFFFRWNKWVESWSAFAINETAPLIPPIKDATVAAIFVIILHALPKGFGFLTIMDAEKKSELPPLKAESGILWWRFVDKNVNYGYFFTFGSSIAIMVAARTTGLDKDIAENLGREFTDHPWNGSIFLVCFIGALLANVITAVAACGIFLPLVMCMSLEATSPWPSKVYCGALAVGISSSFGFSFPFLYTPAYFCHHVGKVPIRKMVKYSFISVWICIFTLWFALLYWAPYLFDPDDAGIFPVDAPIWGPTKATEPTEETPPAEGGGG